MVALFVSALLLLINGFFVAAEFSLIAARRSQIESQAEEGDTRAAAAAKSIGELSYMLSASQLGVTLCSLGRKSEQWVARRFSADRMVDDYLYIYRDIVH